MNIVLNATNLVKGGALQSCVSFIRKALCADDQIYWYYLISPEVADQLKLFGVDIDRLPGKIISPSPARKKSSRIELLRTVDSIDPDAVFTYFGPAYIKFSCPHLMGVADGWITHCSWLALKKRNNLQGVIKFFLLFLYKAFWYRKADKWVVEADCARVGMGKRFRINQDNIAIVSNNCSDSYLLEGGVDRQDGTIRILTMSSYYVHKNLKIIPQVAKYILGQRPDLNFEFVLTLEKNDAGWKKIKCQAESLGVDKYITTIGAVDIKDGPAVYQGCDITFMPSLLETFSAVYPESMATGLPIVTTDLDFAHNICGDAALYYSAEDPCEAANKLLQLFSDSQLYSDLASKGKKRLSTMPDQSKKYEIYKGIIIDMIKV